jgi:enterochelin esterase-like enzyme
MAFSAAVALIAVGSLGAYRYASSYYVYRGFPPPIEPGFVRTTGPKPHRVPVPTGTVLKTRVWSRALGGRWIATYVYLPPGYQTHPSARYPVFYFLHGLHSPAFTFLTVLGGAVDEDVLVAQQRVKPMIFVIPGGPWSLDTEWANGGHTGDWETFVARDLVWAIDARFRTIRASGARVLGGLSEGGYGALNIGLHHPSTFGVIESWSGYTVADVTAGVFGKDQARLAYNSPLSTVASVASILRRRHVFIWFYVGTEDPFLRQNQSFANELTLLRIRHELLSTEAGHLWRIWRQFMVPALLAASDHIRDVRA